MITNGFIFIILLGVAIAFKYSPHSPYYPKLPAPWAPPSDGGKQYFVDYASMLPDEALGELFFSNKRVIEEYKQKVEKAAKPPLAETSMGISQPPSYITYLANNFDFTTFFTVLLINTSLLFVKNIIALKRENCI